jgi:hypothetical protein
MRPFERLWCRCEHNIKTNFTERGSRLEVGTSSSSGGHDNELPVQIIVGEFLDTLLYEVG